MRFKCRPVNLDFFQNAPIRFVNKVQLETSIETAFAIFEQAEAWPLWFKEIINVDWHTPYPYSVGTTRTVKLSSITVDEYFFVWEQNKRFAFYFTAMSIPLAKAFAEDYRLEDLGDNRCRFIYTVCFEPTILFRLGGSFILKSYERLFRNAATGLAAYIQDRNLKPK